MKIKIKRPQYIINHTEIIHRFAINKFPVIPGGRCSVKDISSFLEEAVIMRDFNHPNVLSLLGVVIRDCRPHVVLPFMEHGDVKTYISNPDQVWTFVINIHCLLRKKALYYYII